MGELLSTSRGPRRISPRISVESFCSELYDERNRHALVTDLSEWGLCMQRPIGGLMPKQVPVEFEIPEVDEVVWALGEVSYDVVKPGPNSSLVRTTGLHLVSMASRQRNLLKEYVNDTYRSEFDPDPGWLMNASCYRHG